MAPKPKLTIAQIGEIRRRMSEPDAPTQDQLAEEYGVGRTTIRAALGGNAPPEPAENEAPSPVGEILYLSTADIVTSSLNPRKTFDDQAIAELAASIAANGLLQNLVVRAAEHGMYQIVAGERRFRAIRYLEEHGQWNEKFPCRVVSADDGAHLAMALLENLARVDVPPLEEADAFTRLQAIDKELWSTANIAARIGKSTRYVQQRLALTARLVEPAKALLVKGVLKVEAARLLSAADETTQLEIINAYEMDDDPETLAVDNIRYEISHAFVPVSRAIFDVSKSELPTFEDDGDIYFSDKATFWKHQNAAIEAQRATFEKDYAWVKVIDSSSPKNWDQYYRDEAAPASKTGVLISVRVNGRVEIDKHLVKKEVSEPEPSLTQTTGKAPEPAFTLTAPGKALEDEVKGPPVTKGHIYHAHRRKTVALRAAVGKDPVLAQRIAVYGLLMSHGGNGPVMIHPGFTSISEDKVKLTSDHELQISALLGKVKLPDYHGDRAAALKLWKHIEALDNSKLESLFALVVARSVGTPAGYDCQLGDDPVAMAIAHAAKIPGNEEDHGLTLDKEDLAGIRKAGLLGMADEAGTKGVNDSLPPADIAAAMVKHSKSYVVPTLRFATTAELEKVLQFK